jgi:hypothetical protein
MPLRYSHSKTDIVTNNQFYQTGSSTMSESNLIPSLNNLPAAEYIPSGRFSVEYNNPAEQEARQNLNEAFAAATIDRPSTSLESDVHSSESETQPTPEVLPLDYIHAAGNNLATVRRAAQSDFELAA